MAADRLSYLLGTSDAPVTVNATATGPALSLPNAGSPRRGYRLRAIINNVTGTFATTISVEASRDGGTTWLPAATFPNAQSATTNAISAPQETYCLVEANESTGAGAVVPVRLRVRNTVTGAGTADIEVAVVSSFTG